MTSLWLVMSIIALGWLPGLLAQTSLNFVKYDVIICVDSSVTIGLDNFRALLKSVLTEYIERWPIGEDAVKVGVIAFSTTLEVISMTGNLTLLEQKVPLMYYEGRSTNTHLALDQANTMFMSNGRTGVPKALILLTDGRARLPDKAFEYAQVLRNNSVSVWAIGVGTKYSLWELQQITANITRVNSTSTFSQLTPIDLGIPLVQVESSTTSTVISPATTSTAVSSSTDIAASLTSKSSVSTTIQPNTSPSFSVTSTSTASSNTERLITTSDKPVSTTTQSLDISMTATSQASLIAATSASAITSAPTSTPILTGFTPTVSIISSTPILFSFTSASNILTTSIPYNSIATSTSAIPTSTTVPSNSIGISASTIPSSTTVPSNSIGISASTTPSSSTASSNAIGISASTIPISTSIPSNSIRISTSTILSSTAVLSNSIGILSSTIPSSTTVHSNSNAIVTTYIAIATTFASSIRSSASIMPTGTSISSNSISISASPILTTTTFPSNSIVYSSSIIPTSTTVPSSSFTYSQSPQTSSSGLQSSLNQQTTLKASSLFPAPSTLLYSSTQASAYPPSPSYSVSQTTQLTHVSTSDMLVFSSWSIVPSKTTVPMSSSAIVSQPPPTTPLPRIGGDKSVSFNDTDLDAGLCLYADAKQGFGFAPHPQDCDKYIQCFLSNDRNVTASIRYCPRGLFWNQEKLTCVKPDGCNSITTCRDPCRYKFNGDTYRMDGGCGLYWECYKGVSHGTSCDPEEAYVPGRGCVYTPGCPHVNIRSTNCDDTCDARPLSDLSGYTTVLNLGAYKMACLYNTRFDIASCLCKPDHYFHEACHYNMKLDLRPRLSINGSWENNETSVTSIDTRIDADQACNSICVDQKSRRPLALRFRYRRAPSPGAGNQREEVLIRSRECSSGGLFALTEDGETLKVRLISKKGQVVVSSLPLLGLNETDWRQVRVEYSKGELTMSVSTGRLTYTSFNKGGAHIQVGVCGWLVGDPGDLVKNVGRYTGELQEVYLSRCFEYGQ